LRRVGGRNDGEFVFGREEGVLIAVVVGVNDGKMPAVGSTGVTPTFKDGGTSLAVGLNIMLGEDDSEVGIAEGAMPTRVMANNGIIWPWQADGGVGVYIVMVCTMDRPYLSWTDHLLRLKWIQIRSRIEAIFPCFHTIIFSSDELQHLNN
jgi:hypothetical protein